MMTLATLARYFETLRHLRRVQITNRIVRRLRPVRADHSPAPVPRRGSRDWVPGVVRSVSLSGPSSVTLIGQEGHFTDDRAWNDGSRPRLWLYNLHYFDWLSGPLSGPEAQSWARNSIERWIAENPPGLGTGWEPYPLSLRIANWIKWILAGDEPVAGMVQSLAVQLRYLERTLEWHLLGNHLLANAKALFLGGCLFDGQEGERWLGLGDRLLVSQWHDQVLADGGHDERSPMYHAILLEDVLDCLNAARVEGLSASQVASEAPALCRRMLAWLSAMTHPDGQIGCFNDAASGIAATTADLLDYAGRLGIAAPAEPCAGLTVLDVSGYVRSQAGPAVLLADVAPVGPDHQPGHAHADTLGFEFSLFGSRVLISAGTSTYEMGTQRAWERSTAAHNCVAVAGKNSSDVWAGFRTGRRARIVERQAAVADDGTVRIRGAHDGWQFLPGKPRHFREWTLWANGLAIGDTIDPSTPEETVAWLHLAPGWEVRLDGASAVISGPTGGLTVTASAPLSASQTSRSLGFNRLTTATSLSYPLVDGRGRCEMAW